LITIDALRADVVGRLGDTERLTPNLDSLIEEATWAGRAVSTSSWTVPAMASIFTGLQPWSHGSWHAEQALLQPDLETLPEALGALGYRTAGFTSNHWLTPQFGYRQGFDAFRVIDRFEGVQAHLSSLDGGPDFVWIHILEPHTPYRFRKRFLSRLEEPSADLPRRLSHPDLALYFDPRQPLPETLQRQAWQLYQLNVARADEELGTVLDSLRRSGHWESSVVVVTSDHGEAFGENDRVMHGGDLHRVLIEVPLVIKLPRSLQGMALEPGDTVANHRLWSTLVQLAGGSVPSDRAPSLFARSTGGVLSELYRGNGVNSFSLVEGDSQLIWTSRFSAPEPEYYRARRARAGQALEAPLSEGADAIFARLKHRFSVVPPLAGLPEDPPTLREWQWVESGPVVEAPAGPDSARRLRRTWTRLNGPDLRPSDLAARQLPQLDDRDFEGLRELGYVVGADRE
jgi:arylsulfatase A-like enzyme